MKFKTKLLSTIIYYVVNLYAKTWRYELVNRQAYDDLRKSGLKPVIALWHDQLLPSSFFHRHEGMVTIASDSKDGDLITFALDRWGFHTARGSSTRGGVKAVLNAVKLSKKYGAACAITVDGPKGPRHIPKQGAIFIAKNLDKVIIIGLIHCNKAKRFASWDRFVLPLPFSKIRVTYSNPIYISDEISEESIERDRQQLEKDMTELTREASPLFI